jgi:hypothetical protein
MDDHCLMAAVVAAWHFYLSVVASRGGVGVLRGGVKGGVSECGSITAFVAHAMHARTHAYPTSFFLPFLLPHLDRCETS